MSIYEAKKLLKGNIISSLRLIKTNMLFIAKEELLLYRSLKKERHPGKRMKLKKKIRMLKKQKKVFEEYWNEFIDSINDLP